jgi:hypothetical protein
MPQIKGIVIWGVLNLPEDLAMNKLVMTWNDFMALGKNTPDKFVLDKISK